MLQLSLFIPLAGLKVKGEQQVVNCFKINGNYCFTLIKLLFIKSIPLSKTGVWHK